MEQLLGTSFGVYLGLTCIVVGFAAYMTGQALAQTWKPAWHLAIYILLLGFADRFLTFSLFDGELLLLSGFIIDTLSLMAIGYFSFFSNRAKATVKQYPWLYERSGLFGLRNIAQNS